MIELPEATHIAQQFNRMLVGKRIKAGTRGNAPHKFAFVSGPPERYAKVLPGKTIGRARASGSVIRVDLEPGCNLVLGCGGERILYHQSAATVPKKHQLWLEFEDGTYLTVTVQGWGATLLLTAAELVQHPWANREKVGPRDKAFAPAYFDRLFGALEPDDPRSVKYFIISEPGVWGVGNGYLQDILFRAGLHPRTRAASLDAAGRKRLYDAIVETIEQAVAAHGRDDEYDLCGKPGSYHRILSAAAAGTACPRCGTAIVKESFLGGAVYFCPQCQPVPPKAPRRARRAKRTGNGEWPSAPSFT